MLYIFVTLEEEKKNYKDLINTNSGNGSWNYNYELFGSTGSSANIIKLNNYRSSDGGEWKSYVFLSKKSDPLPFNLKNDLNQDSFSIPGL